MKQKFGVILVIIILLTSCTDKQTKKEIKRHEAAAVLLTYINQIAFKYNVK